MSTSCKIIVPGLALLLAVGMLLPGAHAGEIPARGPIPFATYDKDGNGLVSEDEFDVVRGARIAARAAEDRPMRGAVKPPSFTIFDANGDGQLTIDELAAGQRMQMQRQGRQGISLGIGGGTGSQSRGPARGGRMPTFSDYDLNGDGGIDEGEFTEARGKHMAERAQQGYRLRNAVNMPVFADIDADKDGKLSPEEFAAHQTQRRGQRMR